MGWEGLDTMIAQTESAPDRVTAIVSASLEEGSDVLRDAVKQGTPISSGAARSSWTTVQEALLRFVTFNPLEYVRFLKINESAVPGILRELDTVIESRVDALLESTNG